MNKKKTGLDFLILYEHVVREYESLVLLQEELALRGYTSKIHQLLDRKRLRYATWQKPKVLVASCMYDNEAINSHVYNNIGVCNKVVNLHWEQMLSETQENAPWFNMNGNAKKCVQTCWGTKTAQRLQNNEISEKNTPVTGAVMMDFLLPQFSSYFKTKEQICKKHNLNENKPILLYISSFGYASMNEDEVKELSDMAGEDFSEFAKTNKKSMAETLRYFDEILNSDSDLQIVYRRHPSEWNSEELNALSKKHANFHIIFEDSVKQWIIISDYIFIWMSTAIAEVYFANKTCHILRPYEIENEFDPVIYKDAKYLKTYEEFKQALQNKNAPFPIKKEIIEGYFDKSNVPAYIRMADLLEDIYKNAPRDLPFSPPFRPKFNLLKYCALIGVHAMFKMKLHPKKFSKICPPFASFAGRIYGYIEKAHIEKSDAAKMHARIAPIVKSYYNR